MPSVHSNLVLDHLYFGATDEEFEEFKLIFSGFECADQQVVKTDTESWEGLYITTRGQNYFEVLRERRVAGIGIAERAFGPLSQNATDITYDFPDLPWQRFERSIGGKPWFDAVSCDNYLDISTPFNVWAMRVHQRESGRVVKLPKFEIDRICNVEFSAHLDLLERIKLNSSWLNAKSSFSSDLVTLDIQTYYSDPLRVSISLDNPEPGFKFRSATFGFRRPVEAACVALRLFSSTVDGELLTISRN